MASKSDVGDRVRMCRRRRGLSLRTTAQLAGLSPAFLSMVENGKRSLERVSHISALAEVLKVSAEDLVGPAVMISAQGGLADQTDAAITQLRLALAEASLHLLTPTACVSSVDDLSAQVDHLLLLCTQCRFFQVLQRLPDILACAYALSSSQICQDEMIFRRLMSRIYRDLCAPVLKEFGYMDLLALVLERSQSLAAESDDPFEMAVNAWQHSQLCTRLGLYERSAQVAELAADELASRSLDARRARAVYGRLHITAALAHARLSPQRSRSFDHLAEADSVATRMGESAMSGDSVRLSRASLHLNKLELLNVFGDFDSALAVLRSLDVCEFRDAIDSYAFNLLAGYSFAHLPDEGARAARHLLQAENISPHSLVADPYARSAVATLLSRPSYESVKVNMRGLSYRMGLFLRL
ncbi:helix-turn-helix domain-containing protein [Amycolatopsis sp. NPDC049868]|uniref:helix-turn-helix domain-containing protein n=1 Tax=Amycolatopsis sp. NPDC049868 TaxID=3363934 RepID=UPI0037AAA4BC